MSVATSALLISDSLSYCAQRQGEAQRRCVRASVSGNSLERSCRITLDLGSNEDLAGFLRKKLTFDFCRSPLPAGELYVTISLLNVKPEPKPTDTIFEPPRIRRENLTFAL